MVKNLKAALVGALLGGALGYLAAEVYLEAQLLKLPPLDSGYEENDEMPETIEEVIQYQTIPQPKKKGPLKMQAVHDYTRHFPLEDKGELQKLAAKYNDGQSYVDTDNQQPSTEDISEDILQAAQEIDPSLITQEDFAYSGSGFTKHHFSYYEDDDVTVDEHDLPIRNVEELIGDEALVNFGVLTDDPEMVYVRNERLKAEYAITRISRSYAESHMVKPNRNQRRSAPVEDEEGDE